MQGKKYPAFAGIRKVSKRRRSKISGQRSLPMIIMCAVMLTLFIAIAWFTHIREEQSTPVFSSGSDSEITVCVDPGHGYDDPGALSDYTGELFEKDINLTLSLGLADKLRELGYTVIMTRESDTPPDDMESDSRGMYTLDPNERTALVNESGADVFISLHCNVAEGAPDITGTQIYYCSSAVPASKKYAQILCDALSEELPDRSSKAVDTHRSSSFAVIRDINIPCVLVETGFLSSPDDSELLTDPEWQENFTAVLADGISRYISENKQIDGR